MTDMILCSYCAHSFPISIDRCPHCARPGLFPNVALAARSEELVALRQRYQVAVEVCEERDCLNVGREFERACNSAQAVMARSVEETQRLATGDHEIYAGFHQVTDIEMRIPDGEKWDLLRTLTDQALFGNYKKEIRFAALALNDQGLLSYGPCSWTLQEDMIAHRASVFEENSVRFMEKLDMTFTEAVNPPVGFRAPWEDRGKLCLAKLGPRLTQQVGKEEFPGLLLSLGKTRADDNYIEVHIGGPISVRSLRKVSLDKRIQGAVVRALRENLADFKVEVEIGS